MSQAFFETAAAEKVFEWSLVLTARGIPHRIEGEGEAWRLIVPEVHQEEAVYELNLYEEENRPREEVPSPQLSGVGATIWTVALLTALESLTFDPRLRSYLWEKGLGEAQAILSGEWWRTITALTLHADPAHLLGNMLFGGLFIVLVRAFWPAGFTWFSVLFTGALGNYLNSWVRKKHLFLGASTAVFGALGLLCGLRWRRGDRRSALLSLGAGFSLLGLLGAAGEQTDLLAHLFGFLVGLVWGAFWAPRIERLKTYDFWFKILALLLLTWAWLRALYPFSFLARHTIFNY